MVKFEELFIGFALAGLLIAAIFAFGITLQSNNGDGDKIEDIAILNDSYSELITDLGSSRDTAQTQVGIFDKEVPTAGFGSLILFSIISSGKVFKGIIVGTFNTLIKLPVSELGLDPLITAVLSTVLILIMIMGLWVLYKLGG